MFAKVPTELEKVEEDQVNAEILRVAMTAELDAISFYEQLAAMTDDDDMRVVLLDIAKEEKTHFGEFQAMLLRVDKEQEKELEGGRQEVEELTV